MEEHSFTAEIWHFDQLIGQTCKSKGTFCLGYGLCMLPKREFSSRKILTGRDVGDGGVLVEGDVVISGWVRVG